MTRKRQRAVDDFTEHLTQAFEHFTDAAWLGAHSPLATPFFLGNYLSDLPKAEAQRATGRGKALQRLLREAVEALSGQDDVSTLHARLLKLTFFQSLPLDDILKELGVSRPTYFRHQKPAIHHLEEVLVQRLHPALRLESAVQPQTMVGRDTVLEACLSALHQGKTVGLTGPGGIGKTLLAAHLAAQLAVHPLFWFTFHIGWNDRLNSLLFALAYFLQRQGAPTLWLQLVADEGQVDMQVVPGLLHHDLATLNGAPPLLCFDEVDLLRPEVEAHGQILNFLESFPAGVPIIIIGQRVPITAHHYHELTGLSLAAIHELLAQTGIALPVDQITRLQAYTQGNPRLLTLLIALHQAGEPLVDVLSTMTTAPSLEALLNRVWRRLEEPEQRLLMDLTVYRRPVPVAESDRQEQLVLQRLIERRLLQSDGQGAVMILPVFRLTMYNNLSPESRELLHRNAAAVRASQREYTATAYHYIQAGHPDWAVRLWYRHRTAEINQGQAEAALALFRDISQNQLQGPDRECLGLIRAELWHLQGDYARAREELQSTLWRTPILTERAKRLEGDIAELRGEFETALHAYQSGLATVEGLVETEVALFHRDLGWVYRRQKNFEQAWRETLLARYEVENLQGHIQRDQGRLAEAKHHYATALALAQELGHTQGMAKTHNVFANALAQQGEFDDAIHHWEEAYRHFKHIGKQSSLVSVRVNQANGWVLADQPQQALPLAQEALTLFERFGQPFGIAVATQILAEAHLALSEPITAEHFAWRALETEEPSIIPEALRTLGEARLAQQDPLTAERYIRQAIEEARRNQSAYLEAYALRALGRVHLAQQEHDEAKATLEKAIDLFNQLALTRESARTQVVLATTRRKG